MPTCTFFGHRNTPDSIEPELRAAIVGLIEKNDVDMFYVGNQGEFDSMVRRNLKQLKKEYPHIRYAVVLAYMPGKKEDNEYTDHSDTVYPESLENVPPKFAISRRNRWMIDKSDHVIAYVTHNTGGAAQFKDLAEKKGLTVINLAGR